MEPDIPFVATRGLGLTPRMAEHRQFPYHVAVIMDGNGRWAAARGIPRIFGHQAGADAVRRIVEAACELGVKALTLYAFSWENWDRPRDEIQDLMVLLDEFIRREEPTLRANRVRLRAIGRLDGLPRTTMRNLYRVIDETADRAQTHAVGAQGGFFPPDELIEQHHEILNLIPRPIPIFPGKRIERQRLHAKSARRFDNPAHRVRPGLMAEDARHAARGGPAAVAIHDDGDVIGKLPMLSHSWCQTIFLGDDKGDVRLQRPFIPSGRSV